MLHNHSEDAFLHGHPFCELGLDLRARFAHLYHTRGINRVQVLAVLLNHGVKHQLHKHRLLPFVFRLLSHLFVGIEEVAPEELLEHPGVHTEFCCQLAREDCQVEGPAVKS